MSGLDRILDQSESDYALMSAQALDSGSKYSVERFAKNVEALYIQQIEEGGRFGRKEVT